MMNYRRKVVGMIFAAGLGTRLVPYTLTMPKALVPVGGIPMLRRVIERFVKAGITEIVINVHHHADKIREYLIENKDFGVTIHISDETECLLDTGGGIVHASRYFENADAIFIHNADILTDLDIKAMLDNHIEQDNDATLLVADRQTTRYLLFDKNNNRLCGWQNITTGASLPVGFIPDHQYRRLAFGGVHVISPKLLKALKQYASESVFSIIPFYANSCNSLNITGYMPDNEYKWFDIGTPEKLQIAEQGLKSMKL